MPARSDAARPLSHGAAGRDVENVVRRVRMGERRGLPATADARPALLRGVRPRLWLSGSRVWHGLTRASRDVAFKPITWVPTTVLWV